MKQVLFLLFCLMIVSCSTPQKCNNVYFESNGSLINAPVECICMSYPSTKCPCPWDKKEAIILDSETL